MYFQRESSSLEYQALDVVVFAGELPKTSVDVSLPKGRFLMIRTNLDGGIL